MDFAKIYLAKYGWQEGRGIGRNSDGIVKPIKANLKFDQTGLSYDKSKDFTDHWWEKVFNNAADNLNVNDSSFSVNESKEDSMLTPVSDPKNYEGYFQKENPKFETKEEDDKSGRPLNDEDILKACGGRTAHKGARHGLTMEGKLRRIVEQEKQLLDEHAVKTENAQNIFQTWIEVKRKKHKGRTSKVNRVNDDKCTSVSNAFDCMSSTMLPSILPTGLINQDDDYTVHRISKKKKKQHRVRDEDLARSLSQMTTRDSAKCSPFHGVQHSSKVIKKEKGRKKKRNDGQTQDDVLNFTSSEDSEKDFQTDPIVLQIQSIMSRHPNKKFKVEATKLTPFQKKQLQKSGLRIELESKKRERKRHIERSNMKNLIKKIKHSMDIGNSI